MSEKADLMVGTGGKTDYVVVARKSGLALGVKLTYAQGGIVVQVRAACDPNAPRVVKWREYAKVWPTIPFTAAADERASAKVGLADTHVPIEKLKESYEDYKTYWVQFVHFVRFIVFDPEVAYTDLDVAMTAMDSLFKSTLGIEEAAVTPDVALGAWCPTEDQQKLAN